MKERIMTIVGLVIYYIFAYFVYNLVFVSIMTGFEEADFLGGSIRRIMEVIFETVLIQNALGMVLFATIIVYEIVMILMRR